MRGGFALALIVALAGCALPTPRISPPAGSASPAEAAPPIPDARAWCEARLAAGGEGRLLALDADGSTVRIHAFRGGRAAALGHNHVLAPRRWRGWAYQPASGLAGAGLALDLALEDLALDRPEWRAALGPEFASPLSPQAIAATQANLRRALNAERHPLLQLRADAGAGAWPWLVLRLTVTLNGQPRPLDLVLRLQQDGEALWARGQLLLRPSDFGLQPFSVLGGLLAVQDEVVVDLAVRARPAADCR